jgi:hypothetical protein
MRSKIILAIGCMLAAQLSAADVLINDFSSFASTAAFSGAWTNGLDPSGLGLTQAVSIFAQNSGTYDIKDQTADVLNSVVFYQDLIPTSYNLTGTNAFAVNAMILSGNTASTFTVTAIQAGTGFESSATFNILNSFNSSTYTTSIALFSGNITNFAQIEQFRITGNQTTGSSGASDLLNISFNNLNATFVASPIPEPTTFAALFGAAALGVAAYRRRRVTV